MKLLVPFLIFLSFTNLLYPQCCSVGTPTGGTTQAGVVAEGGLRVIGFYRYSYSEQYYSGDIGLSGGLIQNANYGFAGSSFAYGISNDLTVEAELGYFLNKTQDFGIDMLKGFGFSNMTLSAKYNLLDMPQENLELTLGAGVKIPFTRTPQAVNQVELPAEIQPSTGAFGGVIHAFLHKGLKDPDINLFLIGRAEFNGENKNTFPYRYGNSYIASLFAGKEIFDNLTGIIQFRSEYREKDFRSGKPIDQTGSLLLFISPQVSFNLSDWNISALFDFPFYKYYNDRQLSMKYSFSVNLTHTFSLAE